MKALLRGQMPPRPLLIPLVFTLAAKVEAIPLPTFLANPTKLANALTALHRHLRTDGVVGYFDLTLGAEALGCTLDWHTVPPAIASRPPKDVLGTLYLTPQELRSRGRIPVALDVVRRLRVMLRDEPALLVGLEGPVRLGQQLIGEDFTHRLAAGDSTTEATLDDLASVTLDLAQAFCWAGADIIVIAEVAIPPATLNQWQMAVAAVWNVIRFHEALPVVLSAGGLAAPISLEGPPLVCLAPGLLKALSSSNDPFGLVLPASTAPLTGVGQWAASERCVLVITEDEVPYDTDIQSLDRIVATMRSALEHHSRRTA